MCPTMTSITGSDDKPAYDVLARKTVEILDVVNSTRQLLIEQYNNDQSMWLEAMFRILMWKNQAFLAEERNSSARDPNVHKFLKDLIQEMFRLMDEQYPTTSDTILRDQLFETGCNLISTFRVFTNFLLQSKQDVGDELTNLQNIGKNIDKYVQKHNEKLRQNKLAEQEKVKSVVSEPEKVKSLANESQKVKPAEDVSTLVHNLYYKTKVVANEPPKVKPTTSEPRIVKSASNENQKMNSASDSPKLKPIGTEKCKSPVPFDSPKMKPIGSEKSKSPVPFDSPKMKPIGSEKGRSPVPFDSPKMKPATSKRNINEETFGSEAIALAWKDTVMVSEKQSTASSQMGASDQICEVCNDPITVFNYDKEFSILLHEQDPKHLRAVKKKIVTRKVASPAEPVEKNTPTGEDMPRKTLVDLVGEAQSKFFIIDVGDSLFCTVCKSSVYSTEYVVNHVGSLNHKRNCGLPSQESNESKSGSDSQDLTSDEVDSAEDDGVLRVGSTLPIQSLF